MYIRSPGLPITRGSPGQTVQSGRAGPGPDVYKRKSVVLGSVFHASSRFISDGGCPIARAAVDPRPVAAVAAVPRSEVEAVVPRPPPAAPDPEGERRQCPCAVAAVPRCNTLNLGYKISLLIFTNSGVTPLFSSSPISSFSFL